MTYISKDLNFTLVTNDLKMFQRYVELCGILLYIICIGPPRGRLIHVLTVSKVFSIKKIDFRLKR